MAVVQGNKGTNNPSLSTCQVDECCSNKLAISLTEMTTVSTTVVLCCAVLCCPLQVLLPSEEGGGTSAGYIIMSLGLRMADEWICFSFLSEVNKAASLYPLWRSAW